MLNNELTCAIENDVSGAKESPVEANAVKALERLKKEWKFSDEELKQLYTKDLKQYLWNVDTDNAMLYKVQALNAATGKLLKTRLEQGKESHNGSWLKDIIYWCVWVNKKIELNTTGKNIAKWVIDELSSIPEMMCEMVKHPIDFWKGLYIALIQNFAQTMGMIKNSYTDAFQGSETPEKAYKTGRSATNIVLTLIPGKIGASLLRLWKWWVTIAKWAWKLWSKTVMWTKELIKKSMPKTVDALNPVVKGTRAWLSNLKNTIKQSNTMQTAAKKAKNITQNTTNIAQKTAELWKRALNTKLAQSAGEVLTLPVRIGKYAGQKLLNVIPKRLHPKIIKQYQEVIAARLEVARAERVMQKYPLFKKGWNALLKKKQILLESAKWAFKTRLVWIGTIWLHEVDNVLNAIETSALQQKIDTLITDEVSRDVAENMSVDSWVNTFDSCCVDIPQLESVSDWSKMHIAITGLSSWTWTREKNLALAQERAENAKQLLIQQYGIPEDFANFTLETHRQDTPVEWKEPKDFQGVKINVSETPHNEQYAEQTPDSDTSVEA